MRSRRTCKTPPSMLCLLLGLALAAATAPPALAEGPADMLTEEEAIARAARVSHQAIDLALRFQEKAQGFTGEATLRFELSDASSDLRIDLRCTTINYLTVNGAPIDTSAFDTNRIILPASTLVEGQNVVRLSYGTDYERTGFGIHYFQDPEDDSEYLHTHFEPFGAHRLFPCFDQPDLRLVMNLEVTAPSAWRVVANQNADSVSEGDGFTRHVFGATPPIPSYLVFVGAGPFVEFFDPLSRIPSYIWARKSMARYVDAENIFRITRQGLDFMEGYFQTPYPFERYGQIWVAELSAGAMENPGSVTFNERMLWRHEPTTADHERRAGTILHEMAHMWFGDLVTMRWWDGLWLNESFATYIGTYAVANGTRFTDAFEGFLSGMKSWAYWQDQTPTTHPIQGDVANTDMAFASFDGITYGKGASMLKQLHYYVGEEAFQQGLQDYFAEHAWSNTEISDFLGAIAQASGKDLEAWSRFHLESAGVNTLQAEIHSRDGKITSLELLQGKGNGDSILRPQRLEVGLYDRAEDGSLVLSRAIPASISGARNPVAEAVGLPAPAFVWPNHGDHAYARVFLDPTSLEYARKHLEGIKHGLTRRGVWATLWEMVRDLQLAPATHLEIFMNKAPLEPDIKVVETIARFHVGSLVDAYLPADQRDAQKTALHEMAWKQLARAEPGSDAQKVWFKLAVDTALAPDQLARLEGLLDGGIELAGLSMDPVKRWSCISRLAERGREGIDGRIAGERERDTTNIGEQSAVQAEASVPTAERKARMWKRFMEDKKSSTHVMASAMRGFNQPEQSTLLEPYVEPYFEAIPSVVDSRSREFASRFVSRLFPGTIKETRIVERARTFLKDNPDLPGDLRKDMLNQIDELERAIRIRAHWASSQ